MQPGRLIAGAAAYIVLTFPLAVIWHIALFEDTYRALGYFAREQPSFALGFLSIATQGVLLSIAYPLLVRRPNSWRENLCFGLLMGVFLWSSHVAGDSAKFEIAPVSTYMAIETVYLALQFGLFGVAIFLIYRRARVTAVPA